MRVWMEGQQQSITELQIRKASLLNELRLIELEISRQRSSRDEFFRNGGKS